jgi:pimeloyl-ACP methyl ester carboxylesterase
MRPSLPRELDATGIASGVLVVLLLLAGCGGEDRGIDRASTSSSSATTTPTTAAASTTTATAPPPSPLAWRDCRSGTECATLTVPLDHGDPGGPMIEIAVARRPARDPARRIGSLVVNPGGPGAPAISSLAHLAGTLGAEVSRRFDIVTFDPRGVGDSTQLGCGGSVGAFRAIDSEPDDAAERQQLEAGARRVAEECVSSGGGLLHKLGTDQTIRDLERLRVALGEQQLTYVGYSYGTFIGLLWAEAFPTSVRALVLDGVVNPALDFHEVGKRVTASIQTTFAAIDAATAGDLGRTFDEAEARVEQRPLGRVGPTQVAHAALYATYDPSLWDPLARALGAARAGDGTSVADLADGYTGLVDYTAYIGTSCLDVPHPVGASEWARYEAELAAISPRLGAPIANDGLPCAFWPQSPLTPHAVRADGTPPVLVIGATGDAATPYVDAVAVADALADGHLLTVERQGHTSLGDSPCASTHAARYVIDLIVPADGARC